MTRLARRLVAAVASTTLLSLAPFGAPGGAMRPSCALAQAGAHAAVIVEHDDGRQGHAVCVTFEGTQTGAEPILAGSGLEYKTAFYPAVQGNAVCQVDYEPASPGPWTSDNCLGSKYWGVHVSRRGGPWSSSPVGVSDLILSDGDALGLTFGSRPPIPPTAQGVCPAPQPPPPAVGPSTGPASGAGVTRGSASPPGVPSGRGGAGAGGRSTPSGAGGAQAGGSVVPGGDNQQALVATPADPARKVPAGVPSPVAGIQLAAALSGGFAGLMAGLGALLAMSGLLLYRLRRSRGVL